MSSENMRLRFFIVDAFTEEPFTGNPAGVVFLEHHELHSELMQKIAAELRYSETAFVREETDGEFEIRYFTPLSEIDLCGHATIATFATLKALSKVRDGDVLHVRTRAGRLEIRIEAGLTFMEMATPKFGGFLSEQDVTDVADALSIDAEEIRRDDSLSPAYVSTGLWDVLIPLKTEQALMKLKPDVEKIKEFCAKKSIVSFHPFFFDNESRDFVCKARDFAPLYGIPEESATGTANGALAYLLFRSGMINPGKTYKIRQGEFMGRPSDVYVKLETDSNVVGDGKETKVFVGGTSRIVAEGFLIL